GPRGETDPLGWVIGLEPGDGLRRRRIARAAPDVEAGQAGRHHERLARPQRARGLGGRALESAQLTATAPDAQCDVVAAQLVAEPAAGDLLVDRLAGHDRA